MPIYGHYTSKEATKEAARLELGVGDFVDMKGPLLFGDMRIEWRLEVLNERYDTAWRPYNVYSDGKELVAPWAPLPGSQVSFLSCPVFECLYEGTRGPGKTIALLMDFARGVGAGHGKNWRGILFRKQFGDLDDVVRKIEATFETIFGEQDKGGGWKGGCWRFLRSKSEYMVQWQTGETLLLRHMKDINDYEEYHGHEYPWIGWEEITQWLDPEAYLAMFTCCRPTGPGVPTRVRATTNPYGPGHNWVKKRFQLPDQRSKIIRIAGERERVAIYGAISENFVMLHMDPDYLLNVSMGARNDAQRRAWLVADWNVTSGGMIDDIWDPRIHIIPTFPSSSIPRGWHKSRAYDHGQAKPFSVGWWLESNGEPIVWEGRRIGAVRGDLILWKEWYGSTGDPNTGIRMSARKIARGILDREQDWGLLGKIHPGPSDNEIWNLDQRGTGRSPAEDMADEGVHWEAASKTKGSRRRGWELLRDNLRGAIPLPDGTREEPGLFVCDGCRYWLEHVPPMPFDELDPDDIPKGYEDHAADMTRYRLAWDSGKLWRREF